MLGRERFTREVNMGVTEFYSRDVYMLLVPTLVILIMTVELAREWSRSKIFWQEWSWTALEYFCTHIAQNVVNFARSSTQDRPKVSSRQPSDKLKVVFRFLWLLLSYMIYMMAAEELIGHLMSPEIGDRFKSIEDLIARNSSSIHT